MSCNSSEIALKSLENGRTLGLLMNKFSIKTGVDCITSKIRSLRLKWQ